MEALGKKSISTALAAIINVVWWLEWLAGGAMLVVIILAFALKQTVSLDVPVSIAPAVGVQVPATDAHSYAGEFFATHGHFAFQIETTTQNALALLAGSLIVFGFLMRVTHQLKLIFVSFKKGEPFNNANFIRIRNIGLTLMVFSVIQFIFNIFLAFFLRAHFNWQNGMSPAYNFNLSLLVIGVMLIVLSAIFRFGGSLEEDKSLTI